MKILRWVHLVWWMTIVAFAWAEEEEEEGDEAHPDPNDEDYEGMIYIGPLDPNTGRRLGFDVDNREYRYI